MKAYESGICETGKGLSEISAERQATPIIGEGIRDCMDAVKSGN